MLDALITRPRRLISHHSWLGHEQTSVNNVKYTNRFCEPCRRFEITMTMAVALLIVRLSNLVAAHWQRFLSYWCENVQADMDSSLNISGISPWWRYRLKPWLWLAVEITKGRRYSVPCQDDNCVRLCLVGLINFRPISVIWVLCICQGLIDLWNLCSSGKFNSFCRRKKIVDYQTRLNASEVLMEMGNVLSAAEVVLRITWMRD